VRYTLRQLEIFVDAASDCNFARASARLGISQPAVSDHVRALERNLGAELFVRRRGSTVVLTAAGERLRQEAAGVLEQGARLGERAAAAGRTVSLRIFAGPHIADRMLRAALPAFHRAHPEIALKIFSEIPADSALEMLQKGELDLVVFTAAAASLPPDAEVLAEVPCYVVASRRLVVERELTPAEIGRLPFVLPLEGGPGARWVERALADMGVEPTNIVARTQYLDVQQRMVETGEAAALLFRDSIEASPAFLELRRLSPDAHGLRRAMTIRKSDQRPELSAVAALVRSAIRGDALALSSPSARD
jgi:DNA-binding transcriptional LysR family regulator